MPLLLVNVQNIGLARYDLVQRKKLGKSIQPI